MPTLFISDIHLGREHPQISQRFVSFLQQEAASVATLYILGDLFELWIGDDAPQADQLDAIEALRRLSERGTRVFVMRGNRDFLLGPRFEAMSGARLIADPIVIDLYGTPTLLMHGDTLCTDDVGYQKFRAQVRDEAWQQWFLAKSPAERLAFAQEARRQSQSANQNKTLEIMDVNQAAVEAVMKRYGVTQLIHGHTHRPATHEFLLEGKVARRIVLGDWFTQASSLRFEAPETGANNL